MKTRIFTIVACLFATVTGCSGDGDPDQSGFTLPLQQGVPFASEPAIEGAEDADRRPPPPSPFVGGCAAQCQGDCASICQIICSLCPEGGPSLGSCMQSRLGNDCEGDGAFDCLVEHECGTFDTLPEIEENDN